MAFFSEPLSSFCSRMRTGLTLIGAMAIVRFLMLPAFGIPYDQGSTYTSVFILSFLVIAAHAAGHARDAGSYKDLLAIAAIVMISANLMIGAAIAIDEGLGINTYFTDPAHGGSQSVLVHMAGHVVFASIVGSLVGWLFASIIYTVARPILGNR